MSEQRPARWQIGLAFAAVYLVWGSTYLAIRFAIETLPPFLMAGTRFLVAGAVLYGWARARGAAAPVTVHWRAAARIGALLLLGGNGAVVWAEQRVPSGLAALLVAMMPLWMVLLDALVHQQWPRATALLGIAIGLSGVAVLVGRAGFSSATGRSGVDPAGALALLGASLSWAIGSLYARRASLPRSPLLATAMEMLCGGVLLVALGLATGQGAQLHLAAVTWRSLLALGYLILFGSLIGFTAYIWLLGVSRPALVSTYAFVNPVVAVLLGWALAGEPVGSRTLFAAGLIVVAVGLITRAPAERPAARAAQEPA